MNIDLELQSLEIQKKLVNYQGEDRVVFAEDLIKELKKDAPARTYKTKFELFDNLTGGFRRGQLVIISASTGQGKTSWAQTLTKHFIEDGQKCLWFSFEVGVLDFAEKMPGTCAFWLPRQIKQNSLQWLKNRVLEGIAKENTRIIFIDHLHYLLEMQKMAEAKSLSVLIGMMLRELKRLAIEHDVLIFLISHMRKIDTAEKPELEDLRDSSFVAQESDYVIMLLRETEKIDGETYSKPSTRVYLKKNRRTGQLGIIRMDYVDNEFFESSDQSFKKEKKETWNTNNM